MLRNDPFGEIIIFGKVYPMRGRQFAGIPELVEHPFVRRTIPHLFFALYFGVESMGR